MLLNLLAVMALSGQASCAPSPAPDPEVAKVESVVARTKANRTTYSLYNWYRISRPGEAVVEEWSAEFNAGRLHRVETPRDRVIADCEAMTATALSLETGKTTSGEEIAQTACGINTDRKVTSSRWLGTSDSAFGKADAVRLADASVVRTYWVDSDGVILRSTFALNQVDAPVLLQTVSTAFLKTTPSADMFSRESLARSYVPDEYRKGAAGQKWAD